MARKGKSRSTSSRKNSSLDPVTKKWIWAILLTALTLFSLVVWRGGGGAVGTLMFRGLSSLLGIAYFIVPASLFVSLLSVIHSMRSPAEPVRVVSTILFFISLLGLTEIFYPNDGGILGELLAEATISLFGTLGAIIAMCAIGVVSLLIIFSPSIGPAEMFASFKERFKRGEEDEGMVIVEPDVELASEPVVEEEGTDTQTQISNKKRALSITGLVNQKKPEAKEKEEEFTLPNEALLRKPYQPPPLSLLNSDSGKPGVGDIKANANIIKRTLRNFGIDVEMDEISIGPTVTRYALKPAEGVKLSKILGLQNNLELALAAHPVRIEAPIPGKSLVGIEVPNSAKTTVGLATLLGSNEYRTSEDPLYIALGKGISGHSFFTSLAKAPHLLVAGATGSGKSVMIHVLINSLLFRNSPEQLRLLMVDPKRVELSLYNGTPHLLTPVITDPKRTIMALRWTVKEMERRYEVLQEHRVQNIATYHSSIVKPAYKKAGPEANIDDLPERMPYIVVIVDELGDLMQVYPRELEAEIIRLAQMSRAVGIHLVLTTQRPSKSVITGLIKANVPSRVALQVSSNMESRIILDASGAEDLLGAGDMLFQSATMSKPARIQSPFISEKEVKSVVKYLKQQYEDELPDEVNLEEQQEKNSLFSMDIESMDGEDEDDLYEDARAIVIEAGKASTSYLQRRLKIGYSRAARIMDLLEEKGVIGPQEGSKPRDVLIDSSEPEE